MPDVSRARCEQPRETKFIFLGSYDNTWLCLLNFQLWTAVRWNRKISLAPFKTQQPTHHEKTPTQTLSSTLQEDIWPTAGREGPWGWGKACSSSTSTVCPHTVPCSPWPESQALLSMHPASESLRWPAIGESRHAQAPLMTEPKGESGLWETGQSHDTATFPTLGSRPGFLQAEGAPWAHRKI